PGLRVIPRATEPAWQRSTRGLLNEERQSSETKQSQPIGYQGPAVASATPIIARCNANPIPAKGFSDAPRKVPVSGGASPDRRPGHWRLDDFPSPIRRGKVARTHRLQGRNLGRGSVQSL